MRALARFLLCPLLTTALIGCARHSWQATLHQDHPWVGRVWDTRAQEWIDQRTLEERVTAHDFVLLGETHDNPDHHLLQARLLRALTAGDRRPALAVEMLSTEQQPVIEANRSSARQLAEAVKWEDSGWPDFELYEPIFEAAVDESLPIVAANLPRVTVKALVVGKGGALPDAVRRAMERVPVTEEAAAALRAELAAAHCGELPETMMGPMLDAQRARDAQLALSVLGGASPDGAVLIAGREHVRNDRGVPAYLAQLSPGKKVVSVAFVEAAPEVRRPGGTTFDYVVFTPAAEREDPCAALRDRSKSR